MRNHSSIGKHSHYISSLYHFFTSLWNGLILCKYNVTIITRDYEVENPNSKVFNNVLYFCEHSQLTGRPSKLSFPQKIGSHEVKYICNMLCLGLYAIMPNDLYVFFGYSAIFIRNYVKWMLTDSIRNANLDGIQIIGDILLILNNPPKGLRFSSQWNCESVSNREEWFFHLPSNASNFLLLLVILDKNTYWLLQDLFNFLYAIIIEQHIKCILPKVLEHLAFRIFHGTSLNESKLYFLVHFRNKCTLQKSNMSWVSLLRKSLRIDFNFKMCKCASNLQEYNTNFWKRKFLPRFYFWATMIEYFIRTWGKPKPWTNNEKLSAS